MITNKPFYIVLFLLNITITNNSFSQVNNSQNCFISILDFGAKMDGVTDDTEAITNSLDSLNYAYIPEGEHGARIEKSIILKGNQSLYGANRSSFIKSFVPKGAYAIVVKQVSFTASVFIKDISIQVKTEGSNGIQAYETRNVYIDNVAVLGNKKCDVGIQLNGGDKKGSAWNQINRYTVIHCKTGIELTSNTKLNWSNRNYIGFGVVQSCETAVKLYRADTNTLLASPQDCIIGYDLIQSKSNIIESIVENAEKNSIRISKGSNRNLIRGSLNINKIENHGKYNFFTINVIKKEKLKQLNGE